MSSAHHVSTAFILASAVLAATAFGQSSDPLTLRLDSSDSTALFSPPNTGTTNPAPEKLSLAPVIVTAEKQEQNVQNVPASVAAITAQQINDGNIDTVKKASFYVPDIVVSEFTNRRLSFPFVRGIGSGRNSPAVTTYIDGVPQLSFATSNQELYDVQRYEFLRGPQGTLYGRNTLGGVINIYTGEPSNKLEANLRQDYGNFNAIDERGMINLPIIKDVLAIRISGGYDSRDGYTTNLLTGNDLDSKQSFFGRAAIDFKPTDRIELTLRINGEQDRDGDYALGDLTSIRQDPWRVAHDFEGFSHRDLAGLSLTARVNLDFATFTSITAYKGWESRDVTDLDAGPLDAIRRDNRERQTEFTQEFRLASPKDAPLTICDHIAFSWIAGAFVFNTDYRQHAMNDYRAGAVPLITPVPFQQFDNGAIHSTGIGLFGEGTLTFFEKLDLTLGLRWDYEHGDASLDSSNTLGFPPATAQTPSAEFSNVSPKLTLAYHWTGDLMTYATAQEGFKSGGFNTSAPAGKEAFGSEHSWNYETGIKSSWLDHRLQANLAAYYINWTDMQLDVPTGSPGVYYIDNVGTAYSFGLEGELTAKPAERWDIFTGASWGRAKFEQYVQPSGVSAAGNVLPFAPEINWNAGSQYRYQFDKNLYAFVRGEFVLISQYNYDASALAKQDMYSLTNFRVGIGGSTDLLGGTATWRLEGHVDNAFNTVYAPLAFPFQLAQSGYVGENGPPRTFGVSLTLGF